MVLRTAIFEEVSPKTDNIIGTSDQRSAHPTTLAPGTLEELLATDN